MSKAGKIYLWSCGALLLICLLLYRPIEWYFFVVLGEHADIFIGLLFGILASIHFNLFWGARGVSQRLVGTLLAFIITSGIVGGLFQLIRWIIEHVRIV